MRSEDLSWKQILEIWERCRESWHYPQLPRPVAGIPQAKGEYPFSNYRLALDRATIDQGEIYLENLFDHLIGHYIFCPRSLETAARLAIASARVLRQPDLSRRMVNLFSDIVVDSFRLERSPEDEQKVLLGWRRLAGQELSALDRVVVGFLAEYWSLPLPGCHRPEVDLLSQVFSPGVRDRALWPRQCQEMARILEPLAPGVLGRGSIRTLEILNGSARAAPMPSLAASLEPEDYHLALQVLGLKGDLCRWYRDQSCFIEIRGSGRARHEFYPSGFVKWRPTDPLSQLDLPYSLSQGPSLIPGVSTYKRTHECGSLVPGKDQVPDLLVVLDSSRSMDGHSIGTKTHRATLSAFKACQYAHAQGAELSAVNFSQKCTVQPWTRDLGRVEQVLVKYHGSRTHIPGQEILRLAEEREGCLILCITDTRIQNLYTEWDYLKKASEQGAFVLFCIDPAGKDRYVEEALKTLGTVYYIQRLEDLISLVIDTTAAAYGGGESFISL